DTAARKVVALAPRMREAGIAIRGVRLGSGDLGALSRSVRRILDEGGLGRATIFASGNLDEYRLRDLLAAGSPIDGFGVGTSLVTSSDAPFLDAVYKLQEYAGTPRRKRSAGKATWPGRKQVVRRFRDDGTLDHDVVTLESENPPGARLLQAVMRGGKRLAAAPGIQSLRENACRNLAALPPALRRLEEPALRYRVEISPALRELAAQVDARTGAA
ncbi:MAG: nicotinate phosphoribosyltransferase, partial [Burkholderiales bacterium]